LGAFVPARYSESSPEHVRVEETWTPGPALLIVRNAWDRNWRATVDGRPAPVMIADYMMQGVRVGPGRHVVELTYRDAAIGTGLLVSAIAWALLLLGWGWVWRRRDRTEAATGGRSPALS
jgi:hypothetical protein